MTLVRGHVIGLPWTTKHAPQTQSTDAATEHDHLKGAVMIAAGCFCWSCFYILQVNINIIRTTFNLIEGSSVTLVQLILVSK